MDCPFMNTNNPHCSYILNMQHLDEAFELCTGRYTLCPVYLQLSPGELEPVGAGADGLETDRY